jgi:hypothetical protein
VTAISELLTSAAEARSARGQSLNRLVAKSSATNLYLFDNTCERISLPAKREAFRGIRLARRASAAVTSARGQLHGRHRRSQPGEFQQSGQHA